MVQFNLAAWFRAAFKRKNRVAPAPVKQKPSEESDRYLQSLRKENIEPDERDVRIQEGLNRMRRQREEINKELERQREVIQSLREYYDSLLR